MTTKSRVSWLDSLRGIAAFMVVILHIWIIWLESMKNNLDLNSILLPIFNSFTVEYIDFGKIGVAVFFIVSGYVIPYSLEKKNIKQFLISRFLRLYPIYWVSIFLAYFVYHNLTVNEYLINMTMFQSFLKTNDAIGVFWTLQIEWIFYIICIILKYFKILNRNKTIIYSFIALLVVAIIGSYFRYSLQIKLPIALCLALLLMMIGIIANRIDRGDSSLDFTLKAMVFSFIFSLIPICILSYSQDMGNQETWYRYLNSYIIAIIMFFVFRKYKFYNKFLGILGLISYSVYLLHPLIVITIVKLKLNILSSNFFIFFILCFIFSIIIGFVSYYLIERPFILYSNKKK